MKQTALKTDLQAPLYVSDEELYGILNVPKDKARQAIEMLDRDPKSGFPPKKELWGNRRYLPAIRAFFDRVNGLKFDRRDRDDQPQNR